jgi:uncharacterized protein (TIGR03435 family)
MRPTLTLAAILVTTAILVAQNVPAIRTIEPLPYEVASVKPHDNRDGVTYALVRKSRGGQFDIVNTTFVGLLQYVYRVRPYQLVGAPDWATKDKWEVQMNAPGTSMRDQAGQILKVLQDRFKLVVHAETRELPIYTLTRTKADSLGYGVTPPTGCPGSMSGRPDNWWMKCSDWSMVVTYIGGYLDRPLADRTGISGKYDVTIEWTPPPTGTGPDRVPIAGDNISIYTAIRDQLGVKIDPARGPVEVLVIDRVERPAPD